MFAENLVYGSKSEPYNNPVRVKVSITGKLLLENPRLLIF